MCCESSRTHASLLQPCSRHALDMAFRLVGPRTQPRKRNQSRCANAYCERATTEEQLDMCNSCLRPCSRSVAPLGAMGYYDMICSTKITSTGLQYSTVKQYFFPSLDCVRYTSVRINDTEILSDWSGCRDKTPLQALSIHGANYNRLAQQHLQHALWKLAP